MRLSIIAVGITAAMFSAPLAAQTSSESRPEATQSRKAESKTKKSNAAEKRRTTDKTTNQSTTGNSAQQQTERDAKTRNRADDPHMPREGVRQDPTHPGTPPTLPPNESAPKTPVKPPDPTAPTTVKP